MIIYHLLVFTWHLFKWLGVAAIMFVLLSWGFWLALALGIIK